MSHDRGAHIHRQHLWYKGSFLLAALFVFVPHSGYAETSSPRRIVGQALSPSEVVVLDEDLGGYYVTRLGDELKGGKVAFVGQDNVVITHGGIEETLLLVSIPRPRRVVMKPLVVNVDPVLASATTAAVVPFTISAPPSGSPPLVMSVAGPGTITINPPGVVTAAAANEATIAAPRDLPLVPGVPFKVAAPTFGAPPMVMSVPGLGTIAIAPPRAPAPELVIAVTPPTPTR